MEKTGEKSICAPILTFKYPGREPKCLDEFLLSRPDVLDHYIYDINLTTGQLLYRCKGGIGATREPYIVRMHRWIKTSTCVKTLAETSQSEFGDRVGKWKYAKLREKFNNTTYKLGNWRECAELYLLWAGSSYTHRYVKTGYDGVYYPTDIDYEALVNASRTSREKKLLFRREDLFYFRESLVNEDTIVYAHLPRNYGVFGAGWVWNKETLETFARVMNEFALQNHKVIISAPYKIRGAMHIDYAKFFPTFTQKVVGEFKDQKAFYSELYLLNF